MYTLLESLPTQYDTTLTRFVSGVELAYQAAPVAFSTRATAAPPASVAARWPPTGLWTALVDQGLSLPTKFSLLLILSEALLLCKSIVVHLRIRLAPASEVFF